MNAPSPSAEPPNAILRGGSKDGQRPHLGRGAEPSTYRPGNGEEYRATDKWEDQLRVFQCVTALPRHAGHPDGARSRPNGRTAKPRSSAPDNSGELPPTRTPVGVGGP